MRDDGVDRLRSVVERTLRSFDASREAEAAARGMTLAEFDAEEERKRQARADAVARAEAAQHRRDWVNRWFAVLPQVACEEIYDGNARETDPIRHIKAWLQSPKPCLILCGGVGTGKTYAGVWLCHERYGEFVTAPNLAKRVDPWKHEVEKVVPLSLGASLLVLDDLGTEADEPRFHQALFQVVNSRDAANSRTLITTNLTREQIRPRYGDRIADRLNAMAKAVQLKGASLRKQEAGL